MKITTKTACSTCARAKTSPNHAFAPFWPRTHMSVLRTTCHSTGDKKSESAVSNRNVQCVVRLQQNKTLFCSVQVSNVRPARRSRRAVTFARTRAPTFRCTRRAARGASKAAIVRQDRRWTRMATACPSPSARACTRAERLKREQRNL